MRTFLLSFLGLLITSIAHAEPPEEDILRPRIPTTGVFFIGFDVGLNTTWFDGNPIYRAFFPSEEESRMFRSAFGFEPFGGLYMGMRLTPNLQVRLRGDYDVRTADRQGATIDSCPLVDGATGEIIGNIPVGVEKRYALSVSYITLSLVGEYHMGQLFLFAGPSYAIPMKRSFIETDRIIDTTSICKYFGDTPAATHEMRADVTSTENLASVIGVKLGVGYKIEMSSHLNLVPQIGIDFPLTSALVDEEDFSFRGESSTSAEAITTRLNRHMYFRVLQASVGLRYSF